MFALHIGLLAVDGVTLAEVTPVRERLEALGAKVTVIVPSGGSILPVTGRYYPAAGGHGVRRALNQVSPDDFDVLLVPDGLSAEQLVKYPPLMKFMRGQTSEGRGQAPLVFLISYMTHLLQKGISLAGLARSREGVLSGSSRR